VNIKKKNLKVFVLITSKNSASGRMYRNSVKHSGMRIEFMYREGSIGVDYWYNGRDSCEGRAELSRFTCILLTPIPLSVTHTPPPPPGLVEGGNGDWERKRNMYRELE
jgi:hypothetical protein